MHILITSATGYVGGRLVPRLLAAGHTVRCMVRDPSRLQGRPWAADVETVAGDVLDETTLTPALAGIDIAHYLVHSMGSGHDSTSATLPDVLQPPAHASGLPPAGAHAGRGTA